MIYPGVKVENTDLSGKTKEEALNLLKQQYGDVMLKKKINISAAGKTYTIDYPSLNAKYNIDENVNTAFSMGKNLTLFNKYKAIKYPEAKTLKLEFTYDAAPVDDVINNIQKDTDKDPVNASIVLARGGSFKINPDQKGAKLKVDELKKSILEQINGSLSGDIDIKAPIEELSANCTADNLSSINTLISSFSTNYSSSSENRAANIELATKAINGKYYLPGETFSFNDVVGQRTDARGYKAAPVIIGNKVDTDLGGGICQVSSTLYNAIIRANIKSTERTHHTIPSSYVDLGMDATVDYGNIDYKFKNNLSYPIYVEAYTENRNIHFNIYSNKELAKTKYDLYNEIYQQIQPTVKYVDDPKLPAGSTEIDQTAYTGYKVKVYKRKYENGVYVGQELVSDDYYLPVDGIVKNGTKKQ